MRRSMRPLVLAAFMLATTWWPAQAPAYGANTGFVETAFNVLPNVDVSRRRGNEAEVSIATDPTDPSNVVVMSNIDTFRGLLEGISHDGGATWATRTIGNGDDLGVICCDNSLSWDKQGNLFLTYLSDLNGKIPVALSTDAGETWTPIANIKPTPAATAGGPPTGLKNDHVRGRPSVADQPTIVAGDGAVWVTFTTAIGKVVEAAGAPVLGLGQVGKFGAVEQTVGANRGDYGDVAIGPDGQVEVIYQKNLGGQSRDKIYTDLDPDGLGPAGFLPARLLATTNVGGFDFIPAVPHRSADAETGLAWDRSGGPFTGRLYAVWTSENPDESNDMDVMLQYSDDNGQTWSQPVRVNDDRTTNSQFDPKIALDQTTGDVAITWFDARNDLGNGGPGDTDGVPNDDAQLWADVVTGGGTLLSPNFRVSTGTSNAPDASWGFDYGDYLGLAFDAGAFHPVWPDNSNSTGDNPNGTLHKLDIYSARVTVGGQST